MIIVPEIREEGRAAAVLGTNMASIATPLGFAFNPYAYGTVKHYNFTLGVVQEHFGESEEQPAVIGRSGQIE